MMSRPSLIAFIAAFFLFIPTQKAKFASADVEQRVRNVDDEKGTEGIMKRGKNAIQQIAERAPQKKQSPRGDVI